MIDWLVFSRDRALQLDGLLTSFDLHAPHLQRTVTVLYHSTGPLHQLAYVDCGKAHRRHTFWRQGGSFQDDVREWIAGVGYYIGFLVDDDLFFRPAPPTEWVRPQAQEACFSLRLASPEWRSWDWTRATELDYGYPLALDGHVYRRETITARLRFKFGDPTQLEAGLAAQALSLETAGLPWMAAADRQCLVGIPANRVSPTSGMPYIQIDEYDPDRLCERYLAGWRLSPRGMMLESVSSAHAEIPLAFELSAGTVRA